MGYHFLLCALTKLALLNTGINRSLMNTQFPKLAKLPLGPSLVLQIKVANGCLLLVQHEILPFNVTMGTLNS